jgi:hypothetical protein
MPHTSVNSWCTMVTMIGFLPSKDELNMLFVQSEAGRIGNFLPEEYWSSTEDDKDRAWQQHMDNGGAGAEIKVNRACVRAMRAF